MVLFKATEHVIDRIRATTGTLGFVLMLVPWLSIAAASVLTRNQLLSCTPEQGTQLLSSLLAAVHTTWHRNSNQSPGVISLGLFAAPISPPFCTDVHCSIPTALCLPTFHSFFHSINSFYSGPISIPNHIPPNPLLPQASSAQ